MYPFYTRGLKHPRFFAEGESWNQSLVDTGEQLNENNGNFCFREKHIKKIYCFLYSLGHSIAKGAAVLK